MKYTLVNPLLKGDINTEFAGGSHLEAGEQAYQSISQYFNNHIPKFYFSLENENKKLYHFYVKETRNGQNADYTIEEYKVSDKYENELKKEIKNFEKAEQKGGKHSSSSSSSSDWLEDSSSTGKREYKTEPIVYWWYYPAVYRLRKLYVPTFVQSVTPILSYNLYPSWYYVNVDP